MPNDCSRLIIPVINEIFAKTIVEMRRLFFTRNSFCESPQDGEKTKRITDSSFEIIGEKRNKTKFLLECQSTEDSSMLIRIFEYATQIALDQGELENNVLKVEIPRSAILFLRSKWSNSPIR